MMRLFPSLAFRRQMEWLVQAPRMAYTVSQIKYNHAGSGRLEKSKIPDYLLDRTIDQEELLKNLEPHDLERLRVIRAEHRLMVDQGSRVPNELNVKYQVDLLCCPSLSSRLRYYEFAFKREKKRENRQIRKANKPAHIPDPIINSSDRFLRIIDPRSARSHNDSWVRAEMRCPDSAQRLVLDFTHESEMRLQDQRNLASQMAYVMATTRLMRPYPFHLHLCGLVPDTNQHAFMLEAFGLNKPENNMKHLGDLPWTVSPRHYSHDFPIGNPDEPVIYLSPNAPRAFEPGEWNHNAVYVIGAIVDKAIRRPITFAKARRSGVECIRLPLERYFKWSSGKSKTLTINCIHAILATAKSTNGDWEYALRSNLPNRLYDNPDRRSQQVHRMVEAI